MWDRARWDAPGSAQQPPELSPAAVTRLMHKMFVQAAELELTRKMDEIEWSESFLQLQKESLLPVDFLMAWTRHQRLRKSLRDVRIDEPRALHEVVADIRADVRIVDVPCKQVALCCDPLLRSSHA